MTAGHPHHERIVDIGAPRVGGVLRIGEVIHRRPVEDHVIGLYEQYRCTRLRL